MGNRAAEWKPPGKCLFFSWELFFCGYHAGGLWGVVHSRHTVGLSTAWDGRTEKNSLCWEDLETSVKQTHRWARAASSFTYPAAGYSWELDEKEAFGTRHLQLIIGFCLYTLWFFPPCYSPYKAMEIWTLPKSEKDFCCVKTWQYRTLTLIEACVLLMQYPLACCIAHRPMKWKHRFLYSIFSALVSCEKYMYLN